MNIKNILFFNKVCNSNYFLQYLCFIYQSYFMQSILDLQNLTSGLFFISESDAPWTTTVLDVTLPLEPQLRALSTKTTDATTDAPADAPIETREWATFLANAATVQDWMSADDRATVARYQALKKYVDERFTETKVYRIGRIEIDVFVVGHDTDCNLIALATKTVET